MSDRSSMEKSRVRRALGHAAMDITFAVRFAVFAVVLVRHAIPERRRLMRYAIPRRTLLMRQAIPGRAL